MLQTALFVLTFSILLQSGSMVTVKEYTATTSYQYILKTSSVDNGDVIWRLTPSSAYTASSYYLEIYWSTFTVHGAMPNCEPDYVEVFIKDSTTFRSIGKYCSSNTRGIRMKYMYSIGAEMLIRYKSTQNANLNLRYRLRSRLYSYMGYYYSSSCYNTYSSSLNGVMYSSGYPRAYVISSSSCYHKIVTSSGKETRIAMMDYNLNCAHYVEIRGSYLSSSTFSLWSTAIHNFKCSSAAVVVTRYRYIHIRFYRSGYTSSSYRGFLLSFISYDISTVTPTQPGACTFESDECGFIQSTTDHFNWTRRKGRTSSYHTGPSIDHSTGLSNGYYLYTEASSPRALGHKSVISKQYSGIGMYGSCLTFWYHLYGASMGQLNVYLKSRLQDALTTPSWNLIGEQGDRWEMGQLTLTRDRPVVVFEGVIGSSYNGDIAIDDISLSSGKCPSQVPGSGLPFAIQHRTGKLCLSWNKINDEVILTNSCTELFMFTETGSLLHIPSGKCLAPMAAVDNGIIKLQSACNSANAWFQHTSSTTIRHMRTGKCIRPYLGSSSPTSGSKLVIYIGCIETRLQFVFLYGLSTTTNMPSTTTKKPSTTTKTPSTYTNKPTTAKHIPATTSSIPSVPTIPSSTSTRGALSTSKGNILDGKGEKQSANNENVLSISVIVIASIVCLILIVLAIYFVSKCTKNRTAKRDSVLESSTQKIEKAANVYFNEPTTGSRPFSLHGITRPLPEIPPIVNNSEWRKEKEPTNDITSILRKQSLAIPATFDGPVFKQEYPDVCKTNLCSLPAVSVREKGNARPESKRGNFQVVQENDFGAKISDDFMPMKPMQSKAKENQEKMYLDLDEVKESVEEYRAKNIYDSIKPTLSDSLKPLQQSVISADVSSMKRDSLELKPRTQASNESHVLRNNSNLQQPEMISTMEDLEHTLSGILESIQRPTMHKKKNSLPNLFDGAIPQRSRHGSCPSLRETYLFSNMAALGSVKEEKRQDEIEEEDYLAPCQLHIPLGQPVRKPSAHDQRRLAVSQLHYADDSVPVIPTRREEKLGQFCAAHEVKEANVGENEEEAVQPNEDRMAIEMASNGKQAGDSAMQSSVEMPANEHCQFKVGEVDENREDIGTLYQPITA